MAAERSFLVVWTDDRVNTMSSDNIKRLVCDAESWLNFFGMLCGRRPFAKMRIHNPLKPADRDYIKVLFCPAGDPPSFASLA